MTGVKLDAKIAGFTTFLLVLCSFMIGFGFVLPSPTVTEPTPGYRAMGAPAPPVRLVVPSLKVKAPILPISVTPDLSLDPPRNPRDVGWWQRSAKPGSTTGQTVLTGHTVHTGGGALDNLGDLRRGQIVKVVTPKGTMVYRTTKIVVYTKEELAKHSVEIFGQERPGARLVLITCSGWTGSYYKQNIVVYAAPLGVPDRKA
ncbi:MAG: class F sortase [Marmoricola sp.]